METKNKKIPRNQGRRNLKALFWVIGFIVIFFVAISLVAKEYLTKSRNNFTIPKQAKIRDPLPSPVMKDPKEPFAAPSFTNKEKMDLLSRVSLLESKLASLEKQFTQTLKETAPRQNNIDLISAVLSAQVPLMTLKEFLRSSQTPWSNDFLKQLEQIDEVKTYVQLEIMLKNPAIQKPTFWRGLKKTLTTMIFIRKVNEDGSYDVTELNDIQKALQSYDIKRALELYSNLSNEDKVALKTWEMAARRRYILEQMRIKLLQELAER